MATELRTYPHGVPCWVDTSQPDPVTARDFYSQLFDWNYSNTPADYWLADLGGADEGGLERTNGRAQWNVYIAVDDVEQACKNIDAEGGTVITAPMTIPAGTSATCEDPQGAQFRLWKADKRIGVQAVNIPNAWNFGILRTGATREAFDFYRTIFGWTSIGEDSALGIMTAVPGYGDHLAATVDPDIYERQAMAPEGFADVVAGIEPSKSGESSRWQVQFTVADRERTIGIAEHNGASVLGTSENQWTRNADIRDPQGAEFTICQFAPQM